MPRRLPAPPHSATMQPVSANEASDGELILRTGNGDRNGVRGALPPLCALGFRARAAPPGRPRPRRGRCPGDVRLDLARRPHVQARARPGSAVALRRRAQRDRRPRPDAARACRSRPPSEVSGDAGPAERAEDSWTSWRIHRALEELNENERTVSSSPTGAGSRSPRSRSTSESPWELSKRGREPLWPGSPTCWKRSWDNDDREA